MEFLPPKKAEMLVELLRAEPQESSTLVQFRRKGKPLGDAVTVAQLAQLAAADQCWSISFLFSPTSSASLFSMCPSPLFVRIWRPTASGDKESVTREIPLVNITFSPTRHVVSLPSAENPSAGTLKPAVGPVTLHLRIRVLTVEERLRRAVVRVQHCLKNEAPAYTLLDRAPSVLRFLHALTQHAIITPAPAAPSHAAEAYSGFCCLEDILCSASRAVGPLAGDSHRRSGKAAMLKLPVVIVGIAQLFPGFTAPFTLAALEHEVAALSIGESREPPSRSAKGLRDFPTDSTAISSDLSALSDLQATLSSVSSGDVESVYREAVSAILGASDVLTQLPFIGAAVVVLANFVCAVIANKQVRLVAARTTRYLVTLLSQLVTPSVRNMASDGPAAEVLVELFRGIQAAHATICKHQEQYLVCQWATASSTLRTIESHCRELDLLFSRFHDMVSLRFMGEQSRATQGIIERLDFIASYLFTVSSRDATHASLQELAEQMRWDMAFASVDMPEPRAKELGALQRQLSSSSALSRDDMLLALQGIQRTAKELLRPATTASDARQICQTAYERMFSDLRATFLVPRLVVDDEHERVSVRQLLSFVLWHSSPVIREKHRKKRITAIQGPMGCGKSALLLYLGSRQTSEAHVDFECPLGPAIVVKLADVAAFVATLPPPATVSRAALITAVTRGIPVSDADKLRLSEYDGPIVWLLDGFDEVSNALFVSQAFADLVAQWVCDVERDHGGPVDPRDAVIAACRPEYMPTIRCSGSDCRVFPQSTSVFLSMETWTAVDVRSFVRMHEEQGVLSRQQCATLLDSVFRHGAPHAEQLFQLPVFLHSMVRCVLHSSSNPPSDAAQQQVQEAAAAAPPHTGGTPPLLLAAVGPHATLEQVFYICFCDTQRCGLISASLSASRALRCLEDVIEAAHEGRFDAAQWDDCMRDFLAPMRLVSSSALWDASLLRSSGLRAPLMVHHVFTSWVLARVLLRRLRDAERLAVPTAAASAETFVKACVPLSETEIGATRTTLQLLASMSRDDPAARNRVAQIVVDVFWALVKKQNLPSTSVLRERPATARALTNKIGLITVAEVAVVLSSPVDEIGLESGAARGAPLHTVTTNVVVDALLKKSKFFFTSPRIFRLLLAPSVSIVSASLFHQLVHVVDKLGVFPQSVSAKEARFLHHVLITHVTAANAADALKILQTLQRVEPSLAASSLLSSVKLRRIAEARSRMNELSSTGTSLSGKDEADLLCALQYCATHWDHDELLDVVLQCVATGPPAMVALASHAIWECCSGDVHRKALVHVVCARCRQDPMVASSVMSHDAGSRLLSELLRAPASPSVTESTRGCGGGDAAVVASGELTMEFDSLHIDGIRQTGVHHRPHEPLMTLVVALLPRIAVRKLTLTLAYPFSPATTTGREAWAALWNAVSHSSSIAEVVLSNWTWGRRSCAKLALSLIPEGALAKLLSLTVDPCPITPHELATVPDLLIGCPTLVTLVNRNWKQAHTAAVTQRGGWSLHCTISARAGSVSGAAQVDDDADRCRALSEHEALQSVSDTEIVKIVVVGDSGVGKSNLVTRFGCDDFSEDTPATIGVEFITKTVESAAGRRLRIQLWDTAGQERFRAVSRSIFFGAHGAVVVYDITNAQSFHHVTHWISELRAFLPSAAAVVLVGNKSDLLSRRQVVTSDAESFAYRHGTKFVEVSARDNVNVSRAVALALPSSIPAGFVDAISARPQKRNLFDLKALVN